MKEDADIAKLKKQKFQDERDLAEATKKYQKRLEDEAKAKSQEKVDEFNAEKAKSDSAKDGLYGMKGTGENKSVPTDIKGSSINSDKSNKSNKSNDNSNNKSSNVNKETVNYGKAAVDKSFEMSASVNSLSKTNVDDGVAWIESSAGDFMGFTTYKDIDDD